MLGCVARQSVLCCLLRCAPACSGGFGVLSPVLCSSARLAPGEASAYHLQPAFSSWAECARGCGSVLPPVLHSSVLRTGAMCCLLCCAAALCQTQSVCAVMEPCPARCHPLNMLVCNAQSQAETQLKWPCSMLSLIHALSRGKAQPQAVTQQKAWAHQPECSNLSASARC